MSKVVVVALYLIQRRKGKAITRRKLLVRCDFRNIASSQLVTVMIYARVYKPTDYDEYQQCQR